MLVAQNSLGPVCPVPLTVRGKRRRSTSRNHRRDRRIEKPRASSDWRSTVINAMQDKEAENEPAADRADDVKPVEA